MEGSTRVHARDGAPGAKRHCISRARGDWLAGLIRGLGELRAGRELTQHSPGTGQESLRPPRGAREAPYP